MILQLHDPARDLDARVETKKAAPTVFGNQDAIAQRSSPELVSNRATAPGKRRQIFGDRALTGKPVCAHGFNRSENSAILCGNPAQSSKCSMKLRTEFTAQMAQSWEAQARGNTPGSLAKNSLGLKKLRSSEDSCLCFAGSHSGLKCISAFVAVR
jgi:hypothetical protein